MIDLSDVFEGTLTFLGTGNFTETAGEYVFRTSGTLALEQASSKFVSTSTAMRSRTGHRG